jgi:hypothetical protein
MPASHAMQVPRYSPEILQRKLQQNNCYVWLQQCLRGALRVCPNTRTAHGTSFIPQLRNVLRAVFKSAFTAVFRNVFGSTANRVAAGACRVKDGYQRHSCLAISSSGKASRNLRGTTPRTPGRYSITPSVPGTTGTSSPTPNRTAGSAHRPRHWLDARYVDGDDGRYRLGSLHHHVSDTGSGPSGSRLCLPGDPQPVCSPAQPCPISRMAASSGEGSRGHSRSSHGQLTGTTPRRSSDSNVVRSGRQPILLFSRSPTSSLPFGRGSGDGRAAQPRRSYVQKTRFCEGKTVTVLNLIRYCRWQELRPARYPSYGDFPYPPGTQKYTLRAGRPPPIVPA